MAKCRNNKCRLADQPAGGGRAGGQAGRWAGGRAGGRAEAHDWAKPTITCLSEIHRFLLDVSGGPWVVCVLVCAVLGSSWSSQAWLQVGREYSRPVWIPAGGAVGSLWPFPGSRQTGNPGDAACPRALGISLCVRCGACVLGGHTVGD